MVNKKEIILSFKEYIKEAKDQKDLQTKKNIFLKNNIIPLVKNIKNIDIKLRKNFGQEINDIKEELEKIYEDYFKLKSIDDTFFPEYPLIIPTKILVSGANNLIDQTIIEICDFFANLGFNLINGDDITTKNYNFDFLNVPENHPARDDHDSFYIDDNKLLRSHCTAETAKLIYQNQDDEIKIISLGNVYRNDEDDATHSHQFNQVDMVWLRKDLSIKNLKWLVDKFLAHIFKIQNLKTRYRLSYFPFTEPSFEVDIECFKCHANGCNICKKSGWVEILGAGIFHPNVINNLKVKKEMIGLAFGIGIDRIIMIKYGITDIRYLYNNDFRLLKQIKNIFN
ncbi:MAG: phenylalanine--tRNA ligase subunit alpha [Mycoplasmoidaceae bacterium]